MTIDHTAITAAEIGSGLAVIAMGGDLGELASACREQARLSEGVVRQRLLRAVAAMELAAEVYAAMKAELATCATTA